MIKNTLYKKRTVNNIHNMQMLTANTEITVTVITQACMYCITVELREKANRRSVCTTDPCHSTLSENILMMFYG